jgi:hypothetical protein
LNTTKHNTQIHLQTQQLKHLKHIIENTDDALIVLTTFWRYFHEYITYALHRNGIDVGRNMLPLPMGITNGKQNTRKFLHHHRIKQQENGYHLNDIEEQKVSASMIGRSADDESEYTSRADEIEAWLKTYGERYLGGSEHNDATDSNDNTKEEYEFHSTHWKYVILDDRPSAAKPGTPLHSRFVHTKTEMGLTEEDAERAIRLLKFGPKSSFSTKLSGGSRLFFY